MLFCFVEISVELGGGKAAVGYDVEDDRDVTLPEEGREGGFHAFYAVGTEIPEAEALGKLSQGQAHVGGKAFVKLVKPGRRLYKAENSTASVVEHGKTECRGNAAYGQRSHIVLRRHIAGDEDGEVAVGHGGSDSRGRASVDAAHAAVAVGAVDVSVVAQLDIAYRRSVSSLEIGAGGNGLHQHIYGLEVAPVGRGREFAVAASGTLGKPAPSVAVKVLPSPVFISAMSPLFKTKEPIIWTWNGF